MGDQVAGVSLWREGLRSFGRDWREWLPLGVVFFFLLGIMNVVLTNFLPAFQEQIAALAAQKDPKAMAAFLLEQSPTISAFSVVMILVMFIQRYVFLCFFLKREMPAEFGSANTREFFCFASKGIQLSFVIVIPAIVLGAASIIALSYAKLSLNISVGISMFLALILAIWLMQRLTLVMPLAAGKKAKPIKTSWNLTRGKALRLFGNMIVLGLIMMGAYLLFALVVIVLTTVLGLMSTGLVPDLTHWIPIFFKCVVSSALQVLISGVALAYMSAVCRILYEERKQIDPSFIILTRN